MICRQSTSGSLISEFGTLGWLHGSLRFLWILIPLALLQACAKPNNAQVIEEFNKLYPGATFQQSTVGAKISAEYKTILYRRYILTLRFDNQPPSGTFQDLPVGEPIFSIMEVNLVLPYPGGWEHSMGSFQTGFGIRKWNQLVAAHGDAIKVFPSLKTESPVVGIERVLNPMAGVAPGSTPGAAPPAINFVRPVVPGIRGFPSDAPQATSSSALKQ